MRGLPATCGQRPVSGPPSRGGQKWSVAAHGALRRPPLPRIVALLCPGGARRTGSARGGPATSAPWSAATRPSPSTRRSSAPASSARTPCGSSRATPRASGSYPLQPVAPRGRVRPPGRHLAGPLRAGGRRAPDKLQRSSGAPLALTVAARDTRDRLRARPPPARRSGASRWPTTSPWRAPSRCSSRACATSLGTRAGWRPAPAHLSRYLTPTMPRLLRLRPVPPELERVAPAWGDSVLAFLPRDGRVHRLTLAPRALRDTALASAVHVGAPRESLLRASATRGRPGCRGATGGGAFPMPADFAYVGDPGRFAGRGRHRVSHLAVATLDHGSARLLVTPRAPQARGRRRSPSATRKPSAPWWWPPTAATPGASRSSTARRATRPCGSTSSAARPTPRARSRSTARGASCTRASQLRPARRHLRGGRRAVHRRRQHHPRHGVPRRGPRRAPRPRGGHLAPGLRARAELRRDARAPLGLAHALAQRPLALHLPPRGVGRRARAAPRRPPAPPSARWPSRATPWWPSCPPRGRSARCATRRAPTRWPRRGRWAASSPLVRRPTATSAPSPSRRPQRARPPRAAPPRAVRAPPAALAAGGAGPRGAHPPGATARALRHAPGLGRRRDDLLVARAGQFC